MSRHLQLYSFGNNDRSGKIRWTAMELGYEVEEKRLELGQHSQPEYKAINPYAQVPAMELDGQVYIESTACMICLAERHPESGLIPEEARLRERFWQQLAVATNTLENFAVMHILAAVGIADAGWAPLIEPGLKPRMTYFAGTMPEQGWLLGDEFTLADIAAGYVLRIGVASGMLDYAGKLTAYLQRLQQRPAAQAARFFDVLDQT